MQSPATTTDTTSNLLARSSINLVLAPNNLIMTPNSMNNNSNILDMEHFVEIASALQFHFLSLLTDRGKRKSSIDYIKEAYTQGLLPNNLRFILAPYA